MKKHGGLGAWITHMVLLVVLAVALAAPVCAATDRAGAQQAIIEGAWAEEAKIDLRQYQIPVSQIKDLYVDLAYSYELPWWANDSFSYWYKDGYVTYLAPKYLPDGVYDRALYEQKVQEVLEAAVSDGMSDWQAALAIHDYLVTHYCYDQTYEYHEGYDLLVGGTAVCEGYAKAYMDLLQRLGIPCVVVTSDAMYHGWNLVKIGGQWYHVDVTWGDPTPDIYGRVDHSYFLLSDATISDAEHGHYSWRSSIACTDTSYETGVYWEGLSSAVCYPNGGTSILRRENGTVTNIHLRNEYTGQETQLWSVDEGYLDIGTGSRYNYQNYGLSLWQEYIYFSDMQNVYKLSMSGGTPEVVYSYDTAGNGRVIMGTHLVGDILYVTTRNHAGEISSMAIALGGEQLPSYAAGGSAMNQSGSGAQQGSDVTPAPEEEIPDSPYLDVVWGDYFFDAAVWADEMDIVNGSLEGYLNPNGECTRAQMVSFLWRAMGCPEPSAQNGAFEDVNAEDYYYKAVLWALENGITTGADETHFAPDSVCTRAQMVTFLWRAEGMPNASQMATELVDVDAAAYYYRAVLWAAERGIAAGVDATHFAPDGICTRAQAITFLYRSAA